MADRSSAFVPAAGHDWLLPLYDPLLRLLGADSARRDLVVQTGLQPGQRVLDIGCGTGSLVVLVAHLHPQADVVGLDPDARALARARRKAERAGLAVRFDQGYSQSLPYPDAAFDRVLSSFMLHHLEPDAKARTLEEARRVLEPGGSLHVLDFGGGGPRRDGLLARALHRAEHGHDHFEGGIPALMAEAGFDGAREVGHRATLLGRVTRCAATAPARRRAGPPA